MRHFNLKPLRVHRAFRYSIPNGVYLAEARGYTNSQVQCIVEENLRRSGDDRPVRVKRGRQHRSNIYVQIGA